MNETVVAELASWKGPRAYRMQPCSREIKMLRPICGVCAAASGGKKYLPSLWFETCQHDPYVTYREVTTPTPTYEPVDPEVPNGAKKVVRVEDIVTIEPRPNWVSTSLAGGLNKGRGVERALWKGFIYPQSLRSPTYPGGIKRRCQFRDCLAEDVKRFTNGWFCREEEAKLVAVSDSETTYQVSFDARSDKIQKGQLDTVQVRT